MKKSYWLFVMIFILIFTTDFKVKAQDIEITSVSRYSVKGATDYSNTISGNNTININSSFRYSEQYIQYKMTFQNTSDYDYILLLPDNFNSNLILLMKLIMILFLVILPK